MRTNGNLVNSVIRALSILECYLDVDELKFTDIVKKARLSNGTVNRLLETLMEKDFIIKKENGNYSLGNKNHNGEVVGAISISGFSDRMDNNLDFLKPYREQKVKYYINSYN